MTEKNQSESWVDSRNIRPTGWVPPKMTEKGYARLFDSFEGEQKKIIIAGHLSNLNGAALIAYECHLFYTDNLSPSILISDHWSPWLPSNETSTSIRALLPHLEPDIQEFCKVWLKEIQVLDDLNQEWAYALAKFLNLNIPKSEDDFQVLRNRIELYRKEHGADWVKLPDFQPLVSQLDLTVIKMQQLLPKLGELIQTMYSQHSLEDIEALAGNQKIEFQIESSRNEPSHKRAIKKLNRLFKDKPNQIQSSQIYMELGFRYAELDEITQAIENYTKSIDLARLPNALVYFWRGELYYREKEWKKAVKDFEQAIALEIYTPEREQALQYIAELQSS